MSAPARGPAEVIRYLRPTQMATMLGESVPVSADHLGPMRAALADLARTKPAAFRAAVKRVDTDRPGWLTGILGNQR